MLDDALSDALDRAIAGLPDACGHAPASAAALRSWSARLSPTRRARDYFAGGRAVMLLLPWWLEKRIRPSPDIEFQSRLVDSSVNAYYFVRLIDDVMDGEGTDARRILPLAGMLHTRFLRSYVALFPPNAPFWDHFDRFWNETLEAALREKALSDVRADDFAAIAARKTAGIKIPIAAVCCRYDRPDLLDGWCDFHDRFACWQQMVNDTFDWVRDRRHGNVTFFLSEARRQARAGESVAAWVVRRGFAWATAWLADAMRDARRRAGELESPELLRFLDYREAELRDRELDLAPRLRALATVADAFESVR